MNFREIVGQGIIVNSLHAMIKEDKVSNGYIFCGPRGSGRTLITGVFAMALNCKEQDEERPCEKCSSCIKFLNGNHPNVDFIRPTGASIKIKQIRELIGDIAKKPYETGYKVVIIENADKMTHEAQDAFLKTLEEPPNNTVFVLETENYNLLQPTIVSRCQLYQIRKVSSCEMESYIRRHYDKSDYQIKLATINSNGIIGRARFILENDAYFKQRESFTRLLDFLMESKYIEASSSAAEMIETKADMAQFTEFLLGWFRDVMIYKESSTNMESLLLNMDKKDELEFYGRKLSDRDINSIMEIIKHTIRYVNSNVGIKNSLDLMLLNIMEVCNGKNSRGKV